LHKISIVIPAHNEEKFLPQCLDSIAAAAAGIGIPVEVIVVLNRCSDRSEEVARGRGAVIVREDEKNIARVRNAGAAVATGDVLVTLDADSWMTVNMLREVIRLLETKRYVGGGVFMRPERFSVGIFFSLMMVLPYFLRARISAGMFWLYKSDFDAIGGFSESDVSGEDYHFARRLKAYGRRRGLRYGTVKKAHITTSCRKFDYWGDWYLFKNPKMVRDILGGRSRQAADSYYYDVKR
jgi:glycosyltransferase involved in cell wall biosynthesis